MSMPKSVHSSPIAKDAHYDWQSFFSCWSKWISNNHQYSYISVSQEKKANQMFFSGDYNAVVANFEKNNNTKLPKSYRDFMLMFNGKTGSALMSGENNNQALFKIDELSKFSKSQGVIKDTYDIFKNESNDLYVDSLSDDDYFYYENGISTIGVKRKYLDELWVIGEFSDSGLFMLNPHTVNENGEWEAWYLTWKEESIRYDSFARMMMDFYENQVGNSHLENSCDKYILSN